MKANICHTTNKAPQIHIGNLIYSKLKSSGKSIIWLAGQINCSRENVYKLFGKEWINTEMLFRICVALKYNFFVDCSSCCDEILTEKGLADKSDVSSPVMYNR